MKLGSSPLTRRLPQRAAPKKEPRKPGFVRGSLEKLAGAAVGLFRIPGSFIAGTLVGTVSGTAIGRSEEHGVTPENVSKGLAAANVTGGLIRSSALGFMVGGPVGAAVAAGHECISGGFDLYMFFKSGSAKEQGTHLHESLTKHVKAGGGAVRGGAKGLVVGGVSAAKGGAITGANEGKGIVSGIFEGLKELPAEAKLAKGLKGEPLLKAATATGAAVGALLAAPAGVAFGLIEGASTSLVRLKEKPKKEVGPIKRHLIAAGATAAAGGAIGSLAGPVGIGIGAAIGAVVGLLGPGTKESFQDTIATSIERARRDDDDLESPVANRYQDILQNAFVGGMSGMRQGWDVVASHNHKDDL